MFTSVLSDVLESLASSAVPGVYENVVKESLPALCHAINSAKADELWVAESGIEMISSLVEGASPGKLGDGFFATVAPTIFNALKASEDRDVLQVNVFSQPLRSCSSLSSWPEWMPVLDSDRQKGLFAGTGL
jgi:importin-9